MNTLVDYVINNDESMVLKTIDTMEQKLESMTFPEIEKFTCDIVLGLICSEEKSNIHKYLLTANFNAGKFIERKYL